MLETNVEFWAAIMLDFAEVPAHMFTSMFTCARTAGWAAHILEQKRTGRLVRPSARYVGPRPARSRTSRARPPCSARSDSLDAPLTAGRRERHGASPIGWTA